MSESLLDAHYLTVERAADLLEVSEDEVSALCEQKTIPSVVMEDGSLLLPLKAVERYQERLVERIEEDALLDQMNRAFEALKQDHAAFREYKQEADEWDSAALEFRSSPKWIYDLPETDRLHMLLEITSAIQSCAKDDDFGPLLVLLRQWRNTALVHANPELLERLTEGGPGGGDEATRPQG